MLNHAKTFGKFLITPQPQSPLTLGINVLIATAVVGASVAGYVSDMKEIKHEEQLANDCNK